MSCSLEDVIAAGAAGGMSAVQGPLRGANPTSSGLLFIPPDLHENVWGSGLLEFPTLSSQWVRSASATRPLRSCLLVGNGGVSGEQMEGGGLSALFVWMWESGHFVKRADLWHDK